MGQNLVVSQGLCFGLAPQGASTGSGCPGWCGFMDSAPACEPKGLWFDSHSGHMPGLWARSPFGGVREAATHLCFSPSLPPSPSL